MGQPVRVLENRAAKQLPDPGTGIYLAVSVSHPFFFFAFKRNYRLNLKQKQDGSSTLVLTGVKEHLG